MAIMKFNIRAGLLGLVVATAALSSQQSDAPGVLVADALRLSSLMRAPTAATNSSEDTCNKILSTAWESWNKVIEDKQSLEFVLMESLLMSRFDEYWRGKFVNDTHPDVDRPQLMKDNYYSKARTAFLEKNISLACSIWISLEKSYREFDDIWRGMFDQDSIDRLNAFDSMRVKKAHVEAKNAWVIGDGDYANAILTSMLDEVERLRLEREAEDHANETLQRARTFLGRRSQDDQASVLGTWETTGDFENYVDVEEAEDDDYHQALLAASRRVGLEAFTRAQRWLNNIHDDAARIRWWNASWETP